MQYLKILITFLLLSVISVPTIFSAVEIDFSENVLKINNLRFYPTDSGFALYDDGEEALKMFDWKFRLTAQIPMKKGEGPGEVKGDIYSLCTAGKDRILVNLTFDKNIRVYDLKGKYLRNLPIQMQVRQFFKSNNKIILINNNFEKNDGTALLAKILDEKTLISKRDIRLQGDIQWPKGLFGADVYLGEKGDFAIRKNLHIFMLLQSQDFLYEIDSSGKFIGRIHLPYQPKVDKKVVKNDDSNTEIQYVSMLHSYYDMKNVDDNIYLCYYKCLERKRGSQDKFRLFVLKVSPDRSIKEKVFDQKLFYIIGGNKGMVYFFDAFDYSVTGIPEDEWRKKK